MLRKPSFLLSSIALSVLFVGCLPRQASKAKDNTVDQPKITPIGVPTPEKKPDQAANSQGISRENDHVVLAEAYYMALAEQKFSSIPSAAAISDKPILFINMQGAELVKGTARDQSFLLCKDKVSFPATTLDASQKAQVVQLVQTYYNNAKVAVQVQAERPQSGDYTTIHVGGTYASLGCEENLNTLGIAPLDTRNLSPNDVGFVFADRHSNVQALAASIAHEAGHTFGLQHVQDKTDLMYAYASTETQAFKVSRLLNSNREQDEPAYLQAYVGAADGAPSWSSQPGNLDNMELITAFANVFSDASTSSVSGQNVLNDMIYYAENSRTLFGNSGRTGMLSTLFNMFLNRGGSGSGSSNNSFWSSVMNWIFKDTSTSSGGNSNTNNSWLNGILDEIIGRSFGSGGSGIGSAFNLFDIIKFFNGSLLQADDSLKSASLSAADWQTVKKLYGVDKVTDRQQALLILFDKRRLIETRGQNGKARKVLLAFADALAKEWQQPQP